MDELIKSIAGMKVNDRIVIYKDGSWITCEDRGLGEYTSGNDYLAVVSK